jgi:hypothetical protein
VHGANCNPSISELRIAKRKAEAVFGSLELKSFGCAAKLLAHPNTNAWQVHSLLHDHIPDGSVITSNDICNVQERATKYYIKGNTLSKDDADQLIKFKPLDENETITLPDTDLCHSKVLELM